MLSIYIYIHQFEYVFMSKLIPYWIRESCVYPYLLLALFWCSLDSLLSQRTRCTSPLSHSSHTHARIHTVRPVRRCKHINTTLLSLFMFLLFLYEQHSIPTLAEAKRNVSFPIFSYAIPSPFLLMP